MALDVLSICNVGEHRVNGVTHHAHTAWEACSAKSFGATMTEKKLLNGIEAEPCLFFGLCSMELDACFDLCAAG
jgi:hypothetical protein